MSPTDLSGLGGGVRSHYVGRRDLWDVFGESHVLPDGEGENGNVVKVKYTVNAYIWQVRR